jgi:hypothetical protein
MSEDYMISKSNSPATLQAKPEHARPHDKKIFPILRKLTRTKLAKEPLEILAHTLAFLAALLSIWIVDWVLGRLLGHDAKFYDRIPIRYVTDTAHLAVFARFVWKLSRQIWK